MSLVLITHHNENIRHILAPPAPTIPGPASCGPCSYISKFRPKVLRDEKKGKECHKTFGYAITPLPNPCQFLRKNSRIVPPRPGRKCCHGKCAEKKEPCPTIERSPGKTKVCGKNFQQENICRVVHSAPRQPVPKFVDTPRGHTQSLIRSGMVPIYIHKKTYGKAPSYLQCRKQAPATKEGESSQVGTGGPAIHPVPEEERQAILEGLRKNWNELQTAYQHMPILTDTMHKRLRKERMEKELRRLELNISTLERHDQIFVIDDEAT